MLRGQKNNTMHAHHQRHTTEAGMGPGRRGSARRGESDAGAGHGATKPGATTRAEWCGGAWRREGEGVERREAGHGGKEGGAEKGDRNERITFSKKIEKQATTLTVPSW